MSWAHSLISSKHLINHMTELFVVRAISQSLAIFMMLSLGPSSNYDTLF